MSVIDESSRRYTSLLVTRKSKDTYLLSTKVSVEIGAYC
jgi:hypothetical protein